MIVTFETRQQRNERERRAQLLVDAPDLVPGAITDGIVWGVLSQPYPEACSMLVDLILDRRAPWREALKR